MQRICGECPMARGTGYTMIDDKKMMTCRMIDEEFHTDAVCVFTDSELWEIARLLLDTLRGGGPEVGVAQSEWQYLAIKPL